MPLSNSVTEEYLIQYVKKSAALRLLSLELSDALADIEHKRWASWQAHVFSKCTMREDGCAIIPKWAVENWTRQINTPFKELSFGEQESDRAEANVTLATVRKQFGLDPSGGV